MMEYKQYQTTILTKYLAKYDILIFLCTSMHYKNSKTLPKHLLGSQFLKKIRYYGNVSAIVPTIEYLKINTHWPWHITEGGLCNGLEERLVLDPNFLDSNSSFHLIAVLP